MRILLFQLFKLLASGSIAACRFWSAAPLISCSFFSKPRIGSLPFGKARSLLKEVKGGSLDLVSLSGARAFVVSSTFNFFAGCCYFFSYLKGEGSGALLFLLLPL